MSNVITTRLKKGAVVALAAATVFTGAVALSSDAEASWRRGNRGAAIAAGIIGGIAAGALIAGASRPAYAAPAYGYGGYAPAYSYAPVYSHGYVPAGGYYGGYGYKPTCYWTKQRRWIDEDTMVVRRVRVCQ